MIILGDSLSAGYGIDKDSSWTYKLSKILAKKNIDLINASVSGETTSVGLAKLPGLISKYHPQWVMIALGSNDGLRATKISLIKNNIQDLIDICNKSGVTPILVGFQLPPNYGSYADQFSQLFIDVAEENNIIFIPFLLDKFADNLDYFQSDQLHPNSKAQDIILDTVYNRIKGTI